MSASPGRGARDRWARLGDPSPGSLAPARRALHHAAQVISAAGETYLPHTPDTSHASMEWLAAQRVLAGGAHPGPPAFRVALRPDDFSLLLLDEADEPAARLALAGHTSTEACRWTSRAVAAFTGGSLCHELRHPGYEVPDDPAGRGAPFAAPGASALAELARWYANADAALRSLAVALPGATPVRCWPHHFDIALLQELAHGPDGGATRTVGVGMTPGDAYYAQPYWYVTPWPVPDDPALPELAAGHWHREQWLGAVLVADELAGAGDGDAQCELLHRFLAGALAAARLLSGQAAD